MILGIIVIEDVFLAFYLALLQPVLGGADGPAEAARASRSPSPSCSALGAVARYGAGLVGKLLDTGDEEIVVVVFVGLAIFTAGVAEELGVSDAIGAFMIGLILGATAKAERLRDADPPAARRVRRDLLLPLRPDASTRATCSRGPAGGASPCVITVVLALTAGVVAARLHGFGRVEAANIGLTVLTRGEFSFILASLARRRRARPPDRRVHRRLRPRTGDRRPGRGVAVGTAGPVPARRGCCPGSGEQRPPETLDIDLGTASLYQLGTDLLQVRVSPGSRLHGVYVRELRLPAESTLGSARPQRHHLGTTTDHPVAQRRRAAGVHHPRAAGIATERRIRAVHRSGRLAQWRGDTGE